jgi:hypothetical protein
MTTRFKERLECEALRLVEVAVELVRDHDNETAGIDGTLRLDGYHAHIRVEITRTAEADE